MDRRRQIRMTEAELAAFLDAQRTVICATIGPEGRPHLAALWYVPTGGRSTAGPTPPPRRPATWRETPGPPS